MWQLIQRFPNKELTRRGLSRKLAALGVTAVAKAPASIGLSTVPP